MRIGEGDFTISGVILQEPDRAVGVFSLGPRVMIENGFDAFMVRLVAASTPQPRPVEFGNRLPSIIAPATMPGQKEAA